MQIFDCQSHVFPREYAELLLESTGPLRVTRAGDAFVLQYGQFKGFRLDPGTYGIDSKLRDMDATGVDMALLSVNIPGPELLEGPDLRLRAARLINDYVADLVARHPERFVGLAVVPLQDREVAQAELSRAIHRLKLRGVVLYPHIAGKPVDDPAFQWLFETAEREGFPIVLHPTYLTWAEVLLDYSMVPMFGMMVDTSIAMLRLILSGTLERHPEVKIVHPHCGGVLPYLMPRVMEQTEVKGRGRELISRPPEEYYRKVYLDMVSPSTQAMRYAIDFSGVDKCVFGSDHPWVSIATLLECVDGLDLGRDPKDKLLFLNAATLFGVGT